MKNAKDYEKKIRKLLGSAGKPKMVAVAADEASRQALLVRSVLEEDASLAQARAVLETIEREYVDYNDLRVSPPKDLADQMGKGFPRSRMKAETITMVLDRIFDKTGTMTLGYMDSMSKRDLRRHLLELGLSPYAAASMVLLGFGGHAIPVDRSLVDVLEVEDMIHAGSELTDVQGFLERIIPQKDAIAAHECLRSFVEAHAVMLAERRAVRQAERQAVAQAEQKAEDEKAARQKVVEQKAAEKKAAEKKAVEKKAADKKASQAKPSAKTAAGGARKAQPAKAQPAKAKASKPPAKKARGK